MTIRNDTNGVFDDWSHLDWVAYRFPNSIQSTFRDLFVMKTHSILCLHLFGWHLLLFQVHTIFKLHFRDPDCNTMLIYCWFLYIVALVPYATFSTVHLLYLYYMCPYGASVFCKENTHEVVLRPCSVHSIHLIANEYGIRCDRKIPTPAR